MTKFDLAAFEAEQRAEARATSDMCHYLIGALAFHAARTDDLSVADLKRILITAEDYGNECRDKEGLPHQSPVSRAIARGAMA